MMHCTQCGSQVSEESAFCGKCGSPAAAPEPVAAARPAGANAPASHPGGGLQYSFDARRWTLNDRIAGAATLLVLIALFLPWFSASLGGSLGSLGVTANLTETASGTTAHGWLWLVFVIGLVVLLYLLVIAGYQSLPVRLPLKHEQLLAIVTGINFLLILLAFLFKPSTGGLPIKIGWSFGAFVALLAAIAAFAPLARSALNERNATRAP